MSKSWYTLHVKPHKERFVYAQLIAQEFDAYLPLVKVNPVNPRAAKTRAWFPNYLFVHLDLATDGVNRLTWIPGANRLVGFDGEPVAVPDDVIFQLDKMLTGIEKAGGLALSKVGKLQKGDTVKITSGPLEGYEGIFDLHLDGDQRVYILLDYLGGQYKRMKLDAAMIEKA